MYKGRPKRRCLDCKLRLLGSIGSADLSNTQLLSRIFSLEQKRCYKEESLLKKYDPKQSFVYYSAHATYSVQFCSELMFISGFE